MKCYDFDQKILDYLYEDIKPEEKEAMQLHVRGCMKCREMLTDMVDTKKIIASIPDEEVPKHLRKLPARKIEKFTSFLSWKSTQIAAGFLLIASSILVLYSQFGLESSSQKATLLTSQTDDVSQTFSIPEERMVVSHNKNYPEYISLVSSAKQKAPYQDPMKEIMQWGLAKSEENTVRTTWYATKPFTLKSGQFAVLPHEQARLYLKEILYSPCDRQQRRCNWSGIGAVFEYDDASRERTKHVFIKKTADGFPVTYNLSDRYVLEVLDITPTMTRALVKASR